MEKNKKIENENDIEEIKEDNNKVLNDEILPYWLEHPEVCVSISISEEERIELEELLKEFK